MKINSFKFNCRMDKAFADPGGSDWIILLSRTPAVFSPERSARPYPENTGIIYKSFSPLFCRSAGTDALVCDMISFRPSAAEQQWISGLEITVGRPFTLSDICVLRSLMRCIQSRSVCHGKHDGDFSSYALQMMLIDISHQLSTGKKSAPELPHYDELVRLRSEIRSDPAAGWSIDSISRSMNISKTYLHRIYLAAFGVSCMQDVIEARLSLAEQLLVNSNDSVSSIAEQCGYDSDSYFMRQFKQHTGFTPSEYRRSFSHIQD